MKKKEKKGHIYFALLTLLSECMLQMCVCVTMRQALQKIKFLPFKIDTLHLSLYILSICIHIT